MDRHQEIETILGALDRKIKEVGKWNIKTASEHVQLDILEAERLQYSKELLGLRVGDIMSWMDGHLDDLTNTINDLSVAFAAYNYTRIAELSERLRELSERQAAYAKELMICKEPLNG